MTQPSWARERPRVSSLELFFDLVFVFTITQLTAALAREPSWKGWLQISLMLGVIFWMYGGYAWLTNSVALDRLARRLTLLGGMAGFLVVALAIPDAFTGSGAAFGLAYLAVVLVHLAMFARSERMSAVQAIIGLAPFNISTALLVLLGGVVGGTVQYLLWGSAFVLEWISPKLIDDSGFVIEPAHFVERHGLVVLIAIGESVVAVGIGARGLAVDLKLIVAALLGLAFSACLWWSHFGTNERAPEEAMTAARTAERPRLAINAFGYCHLLILLGIIAVATGLRHGIGHPFEPLPAAQAIALGAGASIFLLGQALFRQTLGIGAALTRGVAAALALATIPIGTQLALTAQLLVLIGEFVTLLIVETRVGAPFQSRKLPAPVPVRDGG